MLERSDRRDVEEEREDDWERVQCDEEQKRGMGGDLMRLQGRAA